MEEVWRPWFSVFFYEPKGIVISTGAGSSKDAKPYLINSYTSPCTLGNVYFDKFRNQCDMAADHINEEPVFQIMPEV